MKFMATFSFKSTAGSRDEAIARFKQTGGVPPAGTRLLGRWTMADMSGGFDLIESDDPQSMAEFALMWSDLMDLRVVPVLEDSDLQPVLERWGK